MPSSATIPAGYKIDLTFSAFDKTTGQPIPSAKISSQSITLTNPLVASFVQDSINPNIFHFTGTSEGETEIDCSAVISV